MPPCYGIFSTPNTAQKLLKQKSQPNPATEPEHSPNTAKLSPTEPERSPNAARTQPKHSPNEAQLSPNAAQLSLNAAQTQPKRSPNPTKLVAKECERKTQPNPRVYPGVLGFWLTSNLGFKNCPCMRFLWILSRTSSVSGFHLLLCPNKHCESLVLCSALHCSQS